MLCREICEDVEIYSFSENIVSIPPRRGFALRDAIAQSQTHSSTYLGAAIDIVNKRAHDRLIVFSDEQSHDKVSNPTARHAYMINVASYQNGVGYGGGWTHIDGFSESVIKYIVEFEKPIDIEDEAFSNIAKSFPGLKAQPDW
jgi:hypothetical protein